MKLIQKSLAALFVCALMSAPVLGQVTILDFGSDNNSPDGVVGNPHNPYAETIEAGDAAPTAVIGVAPNVESFFDQPAIALNGGGTLTWSNVTSWNNDFATGNAGSNYFAHADGNPDTIFEITTANPTDVVLVEAIAANTRDAALGYGTTESTPVTVGLYVEGTSTWETVGTSIGGATGNLGLGSISGDGTGEGNVGAFRVTITPGSVVPEPTSLALIGLAGCALAVRRRRS